MFFFPSANPWSLIETGGCPHWLGAILEIGSSAVPVYKMIELHTNAPGGVCPTQCCLGLIHEKFDVTGCTQAPEVLLGTKP